MGMEVANTTCSVLRGTTENRWGATVPSGEVYLSGVPVFIGETGRKVQDPSTTTPRVIREITAQVPGWCGIQDTDQIVDEQTGDKFLILSVTQPPALFGNPPMWNQVLQLQRVSDGGT